MSFSNRRAGTHADIPSDSVSRACVSHIIIYYRSSAVATSFS